MHWRPFGQEVAERRAATIDQIWAAYPGFAFAELRNMDHRDTAIWLRKARRRRAIEQKRACEAAIYAYMEQGDRSEYMDSLMHDIEGRDSVAVASGDRRYTAEEEAEFAANREWLAARFGRKS